MPLPFAAALLLATQCAPEVAPKTLLALMQVESGLDPLAIGVNGPRPYRLHPRSPSEAASLADTLVAEGKTVDLGLAQINSRTLHTLGVEIRDAFIPCRNLTLAGLILQRGFVPVAQDPISRQVALRIALSRYNTGDARRGFASGYVARVEAAAATPVPARARRLGRLAQGPVQIAQAPWFLTSPTNAAETVTPNQGETR